VGKVDERKRKKQKEKSIFFRGGGRRRILFQTVSKVKREGRVGQKKKTRWPGGGGESGGVRSCLSREEKSRGHILVER